MSTERRHFERKQPDGLSCIQFEPEGGGIVLNASEAGLAFHAVSPLEPPGPVRFCISPNPQMRISLTAEIVWMDETKKSGGLRYTNITEDSRNQILAWLTGTYESDATKKHIPLPFDKVADAGPLGPNVQAANANLFASTMLRQAPVSQSRMGKGIATLLLICLVILISISSIQIFRSEIGNSLICLGMKLRGSNDIHQQAEGSRQIEVAGNTPSLSVPIPEKSPQELSNKQAPASTQINPETEIPVNPPQNSDVPRGFQSTSRDGDRGASPRQLWSAIAKGDVSAEVALAELYLTGKGVRKNCEQARVLLRAASKRGNVEAVQQLQKLKRSRCR